MKFFAKAQQIMTDLLFEQNTRAIAVLPGGFKPPHKGHFEALKHLVEKGADRAVIFVGKPSRGEVTHDMAIAIWEIYAKHISVPVDVRSADVSPVGSVYEFVDENKESKIYVGAGEEDIKRYEWFEKRADEFPLVEIVPIPPQFGRISGSAVRENLSDLNFIPHEAMNDEPEIRSILGL